MGLPPRPLTMRLQEPGIRSAFDGPSFGKVIPLMESMPASAHEPFRMPQSLADKVSEGPHEPITNREAIDIISDALFAAIGDGDEAMKLFMEWHAFRERLQAFFSSRTTARQQGLEAEISDLTRTGKAILGELAALQSDYAYAHQNWMDAEGNASRSRAQLNGVLGARPDQENGFFTGDEIETWQGRLEAARRAVDDDEASLRPVRDKLNEIGSRIAVKTRELARIKEQRKLRRMELVDGVHREVGSGLQGQTGKSLLP